MGDLIDRQAAIDAVGSMLRRKFGIGGDLAEITLAELPSAQPERKKGQWVEDVAYYDEEGCPCIVTRCDQCGEPGFGRYCPYCGADMREENDG